jgi:phosphoglycolate phosphatase
MKKYIIFDFNGTLLNDVDLGLKLINEFLEYQHKPLLDMDKYRRVFGFPIRDYYVRAGLDLNADRFEDLAIIYNKKYMRESLSCKLYDDVFDLLLELKDKGYYLICLSSSETNNLIFQLKYYKIYNLFDKVIGTNDVEAKSKAKLGYDFIVNNNINPNEVICVGDSLHDIEVANLIGCDGVLFTKGHQHPDMFKGYRKIDNLSEIKEYLK